MLKRWHVVCQFRIGSTVTVQGKREYRGSEKRHTQKKALAEREWHELNSSYQQLHSGIGKEYHTTGGTNERF